MNKRFIFLSLTSIIFALFLLNRCKKDDTTPPVITLKGNKIITLNLGEKFVDPGVTATDNKDGNLTSKVQVIGNNYNDTLAGEFIIGYTVEDAAGNTALEATRILHIKTDLLAGKYLVSENDSTSYNITVSQSDSIYNELIVNNFGSYSTGINIKMLINQKIISIPLQLINITNISDTISGLGTGGGYNGSPSVLALDTLKYNIRGMENGAYINRNYLVLLKKTSSIIKRK